MLRPGNNPENFPLRKALLCLSFPTLPIVTSLDDQGAAVQKQVSTALLVACSLAAVFASNTPGDAADLPQQQAAPFAPAPVPLAYNWSGMYVGAHAGYGWGDFDFRNPAVTVAVPGLTLPGGGLTAGLPLERTFEGDGILGGAQVGVNAQWGNLVVGIEGDVSWVDIHGSVRSTGGPFTIPSIGPIPTVGPITTVEGASAELDYLATVRGRLGFAFNNILVYGTGGLAFGRVESTADVTASLGPEFLALAASGGETHIGWTAGAGVEAMLTPNLSAKLEYLYADLGWENHRAPASVTASPLAASFIPPGASAAASGDFKVEVQTVKVGLNYRFW
jgi:outer membrane immunogenic protein